ncbi:hypothetical protein AB1M95_06815 [Sulfitobacter sp. LCG007]
MSKAYIGFSTPVGYDYENTALKVPSDTSSSPNPILVGATGIFVLFDEIWFPCRSICPQSMRGLHYVKFVSEEYDDIDIDDEIARNIADGIPKNLDLNSIHPDGYSTFMERYYGFNGPDNHTHGVNFFKRTLNGNLDALCHARDLIILEKLGNDFTPVLNGVTRQMSLPQEWAWLRNEDEDRAVRIADHLLTIDGIYDITGPDGPYHPVIEELRQHHYASSFRRWIRGETSSLHNQELGDIVSGMNDVVRAFEREALVKAVGREGLKEVSVQLVEGIALDLLPGASSVKTAMGIIKSSSEREERKASAYIAESRGATWDAKKQTKFEVI